MAYRTNWTVSQTFAIRALQALMLLAFVAAMVGIRETLGQFQAQDVMSFAAGVAFALFLARF